MKRESGTGTRRWLKSKEIGFAIRPFTFILFYRRNPFWSIKWARWRFHKRQNVWWSFWPRQQCLARSGQWQHSPSRIKLQGSSIQTLQKCLRWLFSIQCVLIVCISFVDHTTTLRSTIITCASVAICTIFISTTVKKCLSSAPMARRASRFFGLM